MYCTFDYCKCRINSRLEKGPTLKKQFSISLLILLVSANINANIPRASVEGLVQYNSAQIEEALAGVKAYGAIFFTDEDDIASMTVFSEVFDRDGWSETSYYPDILYNLNKDRLDALLSLGINYNTPNPTDAEYRKIIISNSQTGGEKFTWGVHNDQICYKYHSIFTSNIERMDWDSCYFFYVGGKDNNRKGYFSETETSDFFARIDSMVELNGDRFYDSDYYYPSLNDYLNENLIAELKALDAKNIPLKKIRDDKKAEQKRIEEEWKKASIEAEEKRKEAFRKKSWVEAQNNPGFRDLKPGLHYEDVLELCPLEKVWTSERSYSVRCYGIDNIAFEADYVDNLLGVLSLDMGPIVEGEYFLDIFGEGDSNIYSKMRKSLGDKYDLEYEYSERDRQLFNEFEKTELRHVYSKGQVALIVTRKEKEYSTQLWLYIEYRDPDQGEWYLETYRPVRASEGDF